jgi:hypothetical protein
MLVARTLRYSDGAQVMLYPGNPYFEEGTLDDGQRVLFSNNELSSLRYTRRVSDASIYPAKFVVYTSYLLASYLAGPVVKGKAGVQTSQAMLAVAQMRLSDAIVVDANQSHETTKFKPSGLRVRGYASDTSRTIEDGPLRRELPFWAEG